MANLLAIRDNDLGAQAQDIASKRQCEPVETESSDERLDRSRLVWKGLSPEERAQVLTVSIQELREKALAESSSVERGEILRHRNKLVTNDHLGRTFYSLWCCRKYGVLVGWWQASDRGTG